MNSMPLTTQTVAPLGKFHEFAQVNGHQAFSPELAMQNAIMRSEMIPTNPMPPVLLLTVGPLAEAVAMHTEEVGTTWLLLAPPILQLTVGTEGEAERKWQSMSRQIGRLWATTKAPVAHDTRRPVRAAQGPQVWLLLDLCVDQPTALADAVVDQRVTWSLQLLQRFTVMVCRDLPAGVTVRVLLLADPTRTSDLERCRRRLTPMTPGPFYVIGAAGHAMATPTWQQHAATALATLLWSPIPSPTEPAGDVTVQPQYYTIGATAEPLPTTQMIRTLGLLTTYEAVCTILEEQIAPSTTERSGAAQTGDPNPLSQLIVQLRHSGAELTAQVPAPQPVRLQRTKPRWWRDSAQPAPTLIAYYTMQQRPQQTAARQARNAWLAAKLASWDAAWQAFSHISAKPLGSSAEQSQSAATLAQLRQQILAMAQAVDEELALLAPTMQLHEQQCARAGAAIAAFAAELPTLSPAGIGHFCRRPRQWPRWLWQLAFGVPWQLRQLGQCLTRQEQTSYREANLHVRRQLALALLQDVQREIAWRRELRSYLEALAAYLAEQLALSLQRLPLPWDRGQVDVLRQDLIRTGLATRHEGKQTLTALLQRAAADEWVDGTTATIGEALIEHFAAAFAQLQHWSIDEWLAAAFPRPAHQEKTRNGARPTDHAALRTWLEQLMAAAEPLWPSLPAQAKEQSERWLSLPDQPAASFELDAEVAKPTIHPGLVAWADAQATNGYVKSAIEAIVAFQRAIVA